MYGDAGAINFTGDSFDEVYAANVLSDPRAYKMSHRILSEVVRVLKPGGLFTMLDTYTPQFLYYATKLINEEYTDTLELIEHADYSPYRMRPAERNTEIDWKASAGRYSMYERNHGWGGSFHQYQKLE